MLKIGNLKLSSNYILAPLAGVSDLPFRMLNRSFGCELAFVEMINARALAYQSRHTQKMLLSNPGDRPLGIQLLGSDAHTIRRALDVLREYKFDVIDFNAACPAPKVTTKGEGASLLKDPRKLKRLLKVIVNNSNIPATVKIRAGWDKNSISAKDIACYAQEAGIAGLFIHGRTKTEGYRGSVDYDVIRKVKESLEIPVIASGDVLSAELAQKMFTKTGCDGITIARGALGNPWIFREIESFLKEGIMRKRPSISEITKTMIRHLELCCDFHGEEKGVLIFRKFFSFYTKGLPKIKYLRQKAFCAKTKGEITGVIKELSKINTYK